MLSVSIGPGIVVPLVVLGAAVPAGLVVARRRLRPGAATDRTAPPSAARLTSAALDDLPSGWRVVRELRPEALGGPDHVLVGPAGVWALVTTLDPPPPAGPVPDAAARTAAGAVARMRLDDALVRHGASSVAHVTVHWGRAEGGPAWTEPAPAVVHVDGRRLGDWIAHVGASRTLGPDRVDELWRAVTLAAGRPDPLA